MIEINKITLEYLNCCQVCLLQLNEASTAYIYEYTVEQYCTDYLYGRSGSRSCSCFFSLYIQACLYPSQTDCSKHGSEIILVGLIHCPIGSEMSWNWVRADSDRSARAETTWVRYVLIFHTASMSFHLEFRILLLEYYYSKLEYFNSKLEYYNSKIEYYNSKLEYFNSKLEVLNSNISTRNSHITTRNSNISTRNSKF